MGWVVCVQMDTPSAQCGPGYENIWAFPLPDSLLLDVRSVFQLVDTSNSAVQSITADFELIGQCFLPAG